MAKTVISHIISFIPAAIHPEMVSPTEPYIKINVDASWSPVNGKAYLAAVLRDYLGIFVAAQKLGSVARSAVVADEEEMLRECELAAELGFRWGCCII